MKIDIRKFIEEWLALSNAYDTENYLRKYHEDAELDDPSVGRVFKGHAGIRKYFENYFIGYRTQTRLVKLNVTGKDSAHLEVEFTGDFPEGKIGGVFDFKFKQNMIISARANLL